MTAERFPKIQFGCITSNYDFCPPFHERGIYYTSHIQTCSPRLGVAEEGGDPLNRWVGYPFFWIHKGAEVVIPDLD